MTLESGLLGAPWVAAVSGLSLERVNVLARQMRRNGSISNQTPDAHE
jgi:hypothetical protein